MEDPEVERFLGFPRMRKGGLSCSGGGQEKAALE